MKPKPNPKPNRWERRMHASNKHSAKVFFLDLPEGMKLKRRRGQRGKAWRVL